MNLPLHLAGKRDEGEILPEWRTRALFPGSDGRFGSGYYPLRARVGDEVAFSRQNDEDPGGGNKANRLEPPDSMKSTWVPDSKVLWPAAMLVVAVSSYLLGRTHSANTAYVEKPPSPRLQARQYGGGDECAVGGVSGDEYDLPFHVAALFIIFAVSGSACVFPLLATRFPKMRVPPGFLFIVQHLGTGVLLATAFVHLLPTAFISLLTPCLGTFWVDTYPAMSGAIALGGIFMVTIIEMVFSPGRHMCSERPTSIFASLEHKHDTHQHDPSSNQQVNSRHLVGGRSASIGRELTRSGRENQELEASERQSPGASKESDSNTDANAEPPPLSSLITPEQQKKKAVMQCTLLEVGILFHSVFIGMSLSVTVGSDFIVLLIAIIFHQSCEGLALGARIARINWGHRPIQPWLMAAAYGCTTPLGQAIGLATHTLYSPDSRVGLLVVGIFNAISAGFLTFNSLIELLSEDFLSDESWRVLRGRRRHFAFALVFLGAFGMSVIGAWA